MLLAQSPLLPRVAKTLNKKHNISLLPLIPRNAAGNILEEYLSQPHEGSWSILCSLTDALLQSHRHEKLHSAAGSHPWAPTTQPASTLPRPLLKGRNSMDLPVSARQGRECILLTLCFSFWPCALLALPGRQALFTTHLTCETAPGLETSPVAALQLLLSLLFWTQSQTCHLGWRW